MKKIGLFIVVVILVGFSFIYFNLLDLNNASTDVPRLVRGIQESIYSSGFRGQAAEGWHSLEYQSEIPRIPAEFAARNEIEALLLKAGVATPVINKVLTTLDCAQENQVEHNPILTLIDYSLPSSEKRLWVFDLDKKQLLFHTYVSHGLKSGELISSYFSNRNNSKASSIGVYKTDKAYYGREGTSLVLEGLDRGFNDNAVTRAIVMHGGWYVDEKFIKKYGRAGRSWGCPALPHELAQQIINTIKNQSLFVIYYPSDHWFLASHFLNCHVQHVGTIAPDSPAAGVNEEREDVLLADNHQKKPQHEENDMVLVMSADDYPRFFNTPVPLTRMLRRQMNGAEYIALSQGEFQRMVNENNQEAFNAMVFVSPTITMVRGYYVTQMKLVNLGKIKEVKASSPHLLASMPYFTVYLQGNAAINFRPTHRFIRWLGL